LVRQAHSDILQRIEHIVAKQHGGRDRRDNLALACHRRNLQKGPNLSGIDPVSGETVALFHPRRDRWIEHFRFNGINIEGLTPIGRASVQVLAMNDERRLDLRPSFDPPCLPGFLVPLLDLAGAGKETRRRSFCAPSERSTASVSSLQRLVDIGPSASACITAPWA
jgi:hypothetical protein